MNRNRIITEFLDGHVVIGPRQLIYVFHSFLWQFSVLLVYVLHYELYQMIQYQLPRGREGGEEVIKKLFKLYYFYTIYLANLIKLQARGRIRLCSLLCGL